VVDEGTGFLPDVPRVPGKPAHLSFDGGRPTSDAGILLLARTAAIRTECRTAAERIRYRAIRIAAGYPDGNDCDALKSDPAFKMAVGRLPESGADLCSQPTVSRLENPPGPTALKRMMAAMVELFCDSFDQALRRILLGIDDTEDRAHGDLAVERAQRLPLFLPIHIYEATTGKPVAIVPAPRQDAGWG
jgi:hypothetical protein